MKDPLSQVKKAYPFYLDLSPKPIRAKGIKIELLSRQIDAYLALDEIFIFSKGLNIALGSNVTGNSDLFINEFNNLPENLVNGQSSLGLPIIKKDTHDSDHGFSMAKLKKSDEKVLEFSFKRKRWSMRFDSLTNTLQIMKCY